MRIKGRLKQSYSNQLVVLFAAAVILLLPLRIYQTLNLIEVTTGFYTASHFTIPLLHVLVTLVVLLFIATAYLSPYSPDSSLESSSGLLAAVSGGAGIFFFANAVLETIQAVSLRPLDAVLLIKGISQFAVAYFFVWFASRIFLRKTVAGMPFLYLIPVVWMICRMLKIFMMATTYINVTPLLFELFALSFCMLFFFALARAVLKVEHEGVIWRLQGFGYPAALFCFLYAIPQLSALLQNRSDYNASQATQGVLRLALYLLLGLFISVYLFSVETDAAPRR